MDRMNLRLVEEKEVELSEDELISKINHYKKLYARKRQPVILEMINDFEEQLLAYQIKNKPDEFKTYISEVLGGVKMNVNLTKGEVHCSDGAFYTEEELLSIPSGMEEEKIRTIHKIKLFGCKESMPFEEMEADEV
jgi:hypothetical protein